MLDRKRLKFLLLGIGILGSMGLLVIVGMNGTGGFSYYLSVTEFMANPQSAEQGYRVNGKVEEGSIVRLPTGEDVTFTMTDGETALAVSYHGIIPDTFVDGADVVVEGRLIDDLTFEAHTLLAKCPSKYESADGAEAAMPASGAGDSGSY